jgi:hypothetical protein
LSRQPVRKGAASLSAYLDEASGASSDEAVDSSFCESGESSLTAIMTTSLDAKLWRALVQKGQDNLKAIEKKCKARSRPVFVLCVDTSRLSRGSLEARTNVWMHYLYNKPAA